MASFGWNATKWWYGDQDAAIEAIKAQLTPEELGEIESAALSAGLRQYGLLILLFDVAVFGFGYWIGNKRKRNKKK